EKLRRPFLEKWRSYRYMLRPPDGPVGRREVLHGFADARPTARQCDLARDADLSGGEDRVHREAIALCVDREAGYADFAVRRQSRSGFFLGRPSEDVEAE